MCGGSGRSRGHKRRQAPPGPKSLHFHAVFEEKGHIIGLHPPLGLAPPLGNPGSFL